MSLPDPTPPTRRGLTNPLAYVVAGFLGVLALAGLGCGVHLTALIIRLPHEDTALLAVYVGLVGQAYTAGAAATAALGVLLSNVNKGRDENAPKADPDDPTPVTVTNTPDRPVPTDPQTDSPNP